MDHTEVLSWRLVAPAGWTQHPPPRALVVRATSPTRAYRWDLVPGQYERISAKVRSAR